MDDMTSDTSPLDVFTSPATYDPGDFSGGSNPSNGIDLNSLIGNLTGAASNAFTASENSAAAQSIAQAQIAAAQANPANPIAFLTGPNGRTYLLIGAAILALALILRK